MGCAASTGPLYRDEHDFATTAACDSANACTFPTSGAGGCPEFGSQFDNDDSAGGGDDHSGHVHDEGHSSDGTASTTPAVLVAALAALAYA